MRKRLLITSSLALALGLGVAGGLSLVKKEVRAVEAATSSVKLAGSFTDWATHAIEMTLEDGYYQYTRTFSVGDEFKVIINNSDWIGYDTGVANNAGSAITGSGNSNFSVATAGVYTIKAIDGIGDYGDKHYGIVIDVVSSSVGSVIANDKARIWIGYDTSNPFYSYADANTGIRLWAHSTESGGTEIVYGTITGTYNNGAESNRRYDYFDVDLSVYTNSWYLTVQKFQNNQWKAQTNPIQLSSTNAYQVYFVWGDWAWDKTQGTVGAGSIDSVDARLAAIALCGMHNCSSSAINGYNAFPNYNSTFVKDGNDDWKTVGNMSDFALEDYASGDTSYSGSTVNYVNAYDKYVYIQNMHSTGGLSGLSLFRASVFNEVLSNNTFIIIATVSILAVVGVGGYFFFRRKKQD